MIAKTQELEHEIAAMESRLASVKVTVDVERDAWRKSYRTGKSGTKWKGAARSSSGGGDGGDIVPMTTERSEPSSSRERGDSDANVAVMPTYWDALELAQYLQTKQLTAFAHVVISEQITGRALLDAPPTRLRQLFQNVIASASDPHWKAFVHVTSKLQRLEKRLKKLASSSSSSPPAAVIALAGHSDAGTVLDTRSLTTSSPHGPVAPPVAASLLFPQISPRVPSLTATFVTRATTTGAADPADADDSESASRRLRTAMPLRKPPASGQQLATCWNCGARFPRAQAAVRSGASASPTTVSSKMLSTRTFCSQTCQRAIESADISISSAVSARLQVSAACEAPSSSESAIKTRTQSRPKHKSKSESSGLLLHTKAAVGAAAVDGLVDLLHVAHRGGGTGNTAVAALDEMPRPPPQSCASSSSFSSPGVRSSGGGAGGRKRILLGVVGTGGSSPSAAPIASMRSAMAPLMLSSTTATAAAAEASRQCRVYQQSVYKLDPELFQALGVSLATCFLGTGTNAPSDAGPAAARRRNLMRLQEFISVQTLHHLSLTSRTWFDAVHLSALADPLWGFHLLRIWRRSDDDDAFLQDIGVLPAAKSARPRHVLMTLTRHVGRVVLENMKALLQAENWHLATPLTAQPVVTLQSALRVARTTARRSGSGSAAATTTAVMDAPAASPPRTLDSSGDSAAAAADLFEHIALVCNRKGEVVAVRAQELLRPLGDDQMVTDILHGVRTGALHTIECRRLRLFSAANRLPFGRWHELAHCRVVFDLFWGDSDSASASASHSSASAQLVLARVWRQKVLERTQRAMQQRLLAKESVQQLVRALHERNGPPQVLVSLEQFLVACHASGMTPHAATKRKRELQLQQQ